MTTHPDHRHPEAVVERQLAAVTLMETALNGQGEMAMFLPVTVAEGIALAVTFAEIGALLLRSYVADPADALAAMREHIVRQGGTSELARVAL